MRANLRARNRAVNTYMGILVITLVGSFAALYIVHIAIEVPFSALASHTYEIDSNL
jgi:hypothetical protein